jgi:hypothetical protein
MTQETNNKVAPGVNVDPKTSEDDLSTLTSFTGTNNLSAKPLSMVEIAEAARKMERDYYERRNSFRYAVYGESVGSVPYYDPVYYERENGVSSCNVVVCPVCAGEHCSWWHRMIETGCAGQVLQDALRGYFRGDFGYGKYRQEGMSEDQYYNWRTGRGDQGRSYPRDEYIRTTGRDYVPPIQLDYDKLAAAVLNKLEESLQKQLKQLPPTSE